MARLDNRISDNPNKTKRLTKSPMAIIIIGLSVMLGLAFYIIGNSSKEEKELNDNSIKSVDTVEYDDDFVKNQADLFGYKKPKNLKEEEEKKIFGEDIAYQLTAANDNKTENDLANNEEEKDKKLFMKSLGISPKDKEETEKTLKELEEKINFAEGKPALPVLILYDNQTNLYSVSGMNDKFENKNPLDNKNLSEEEKQALLQKKMAEANAQAEVERNAMNSGIKLVDNSANIKQDTSAKQPTSYEEQLALATKYAASMNPNNQEKKPKTDILNSSFRLNSQVEQALYGEIKTGFVIPSTLLTEINSSLSGMALGQVRQAVYDTATGRQLLIPQGTKIVGDYQSDVEFGAKRIFIKWKRLVFPNGSSFDLGDMPGADMSGASGFQDKYNSHFWKMFGNSLLFSLVIAGVNMSTSPDIINQFIPLYGRGATNALSEAVGQSLGETMSKIIQKNLDVSPTIEIRPGYLFNVMITKDFILPEYVE